MNNSTPSLGPIIRGSRLHWSHNSAEECYPDTIEVVGSNPTVTTKKALDVKRIHVVPATNHPTDLAVGVRGGLLEYSLHDSHDHAGDLPL